MTIKNNKENGFDYFWKKIIKPTIFEVKRATLNEDCYVVDDLDSYKNTLYREYIKNRESFKSNFHALACSNSKLSFFKIAAIICKTMVENKVFKITISQDQLERLSKENKTIFVDNVLANYKVAFYSGAGIVFLLMIYENLNNKNKREILLKKGNLFFIRNSGIYRDNIEDYIIKNMAYNDIKCIPFDVVSLAVIYRLFCEYTYERLDIPRRNEDTRDL